MNFHYIEFLYLLKRTSFTALVFNISTSIIGAGIMALPATMKVLGLGLGIGMIMFVAD